MIHPNILNHIIKPEKVFLNTLTNTKFVITSIQSETIHCRAFTKLKRGAASSQVEFTLSYNLFVSYLEDSLNKPATFKVLE
jgi:hypothetical protein